MAAPSVFAVTASQQSIGALSTSWPANHAIDDIGLLIMETGGSDASISAPSGWTAAVGSPWTNIATIAGSKLHVFWKRATSTTEAAFLAADAGDHHVQSMVVLRGCHKTGVPFEANGSVNTTTTNGTTITWPNVATTSPESRVMLIATKAADANTTGVISTPASGNLTGVTEHLEGGSTSGHGGFIYIASGEKATAGFIGTITSTAPSDVFIALTLVVRAADATKAVTRTDTLAAADTNTGTNDGFSIPLVGSSKVQVSSGALGALVTLAKPSGTAAGDLALAFFAASGGAASTFTPPEGWSIEHSKTTADSRYMFSKRLTSDEPADYTFVTATAGSFTQALLVVYRNAEIDVFENSGFALNNPAQATTVTPTADFGSGSGLQLVWFNSSQALVNIPSPSVGGSGWSLVIDNKNSANPTTALYARPVGTGATGVVSTQVTTDGGANVASSGFQTILRRISTPAPKLVSSTQVQNPATGASIVVPKPAGAIEGDLAVALLSSNGAVNYVMPSGWANRASTTNGRVLATKRLTGNEPANYTFDTDASNLNFHAHLMIFRDADIDVLAAAAELNDQSANQNITANSITTTVLNGLVYAWFNTHNFDTATYALPAPLTAPTWARISDNSTTPRPSGAVWQKKYPYTALATGDVISYVSQGASTPLGYGYQFSIKHQKYTSDTLAASDSSSAANDGAVRPYQVGTATNKQRSTNGTTINLDRPASYNSGDLALAFVASPGNGTWSSTGWTPESSDASGKAILSKRLGSGEPADYLFSSTDNGTLQGFIAIYRSADIDVIGSGLGSEATPAVASAVTAAATPSLALAWFVDRDGVSGTFTTPSGWTSVIANSDIDAPSAALFRKDIDSTGTTGSVSSTSSSASPASSGVLVVLRPPVPTLPVTGADTATVTDSASGTLSAGSAAADTATAADTGTSVLAASAVVTENRNWLKNSTQLVDPTYNPNATVTLNATQAPDGTMTGDLLVESTATGVHAWGWAPSYNGDHVNPACISVYAKYAGVQYVFLRPDANGGVGVVFDLLNGTVIDLQSGGTGNITADAFGWYRIYLSCTVERGPARYPILYMLNGPSVGANQSYTGDGIKGVYLWGAQLEPGVTPGPLEITYDTNASGAGDTQTASAAHARAVADTGAAADTQTASAESVLAASDTSAVSEVVTSALQAEYAVTSTDTGAAADTQTASAAHARAVADTGAAADTQTASAAHARAVADTGAAADTQTASAAHARAVADTATTSDTWTVAATSALTVLDNVTTAEAQDGTITVNEFFINSTDTLTATDSGAVSTSADRSLTEPLTPIEVFTVSVTTLTEAPDTATITDSTSNGASLVTVVSEDELVQDEAVLDLVAEPATADSVPASDSIDGIKNLISEDDESAPVNDATDTGFATDLLLEEGSELTDWPTANSDAPVGVAETAAAVDSPSAQSSAEAEVAEVETTSDGSYITEISRSVFDTVPLTDAFTKTMATANASADTANAAEVTTASAAAPNSTTETSPTSDSNSVSAVAAKVGSDTLTVSDSWSSASTASVTRTDTGAAADTPTAAKSATATSADSTTLTDNAASAASFAHVAVDSAPATDSRSVAVVSARGLADTLAVVDSSDRQLTVSLVVLETATAAESVSSVLNALRSVLEQALAEDDTDSVLATEAAQSETAPAGDFYAPNGTTVLIMVETAVADEIIDAIASAVAAVSEDVTASEQNNGVLTVFNTVIDTNPVTDTRNSNFTTVLTVTDTGNAVDTTSRVLTTALLLAEIALVIDNTTNAYQSLHSQLDDIDVTDAAEALAVFTRTRQDSAPTADARSAAASRDTGVADSLAVEEYLNIVASLASDVLETLNPVEELDYTVGVVWEVLDYENADDAQAVSAILEAYSIEFGGIVEALPTGFGSVQVVAESLEATDIRIITLLPTAGVGARAYMVPVRSHSFDFPVEEHTLHVPVLNNSFTVPVSIHKFHVPIAHDAEDFKLVVPDNEIEVK